MANQRTELPYRPWKLRFSERRSLLLLGDFVAASLAFFIALYNWGHSDRFIGFTWEFIQRRVPPWFFLFPLIWILLLIELYDIYRAADWEETIKGVATAALIGFILYLILFFYYASPPRSLLPRRGIATFILVATLLTLIWRRIYIKVFTMPQFMRRVIVVGGGTSGCLLLDVYQNLKSKPFDIIGVIDDDPAKKDGNINGVPILGNNEKLLELIQKHEISDIIVAISGTINSDMFEALITAQESGVEITQMPKVYEQLLGRVPIRILAADWIIRSFVDETHVSIFDEFMRRLLDILGGLFGMLILLVTMPFILVGILIDDGMPIFYSQVRLGKMGKPYSLIKFRTMRRDAEADGKPRWAKESDERATRLGKILRKSHLDELPQFINVLRGEMSLVGPRAERPELVQYFEKYIPFYRARLLVKPGLTGWAQVNYGYASTIEDTIIKLEYDLYYIKNKSLLMDLLIILRTPSTVVGLKGR